MIPYPDGGPDKWSVPGEDYIIKISPSDVEILNGIDPDFFAQEPTMTAPFDQSPTPIPLGGPHPRPNEFPGWVSDGTGMADGSGKWIEEWRLPRREPFFEPRPPAPRAAAIPPVSTPDPAPTRREYESGPLHWLQGFVDIVGKAFLEKRGVLLVFLFLMPFVGDYFDVIDKAQAIFDDAEIPIIDINTPGEVPVAEPTTTPTTTPVVEAVPETVPEQKILSTPDDTTTESSMDELPRTS